MVNVKNRVKILLDGDKVRLFRGSVIMEDESWIELNDDLIGKIKLNKLKVLTIQEL